VPFFVNKIC